MKALIIFVSLLFLGCKEHADSTGDTPVLESRTNTARQDSISIQYGSWQLKFSKVVYDSLMATHPELARNYVEGPDALYGCYVKGSDFGSEAGQDAYYILYAFFLKQKHDGEEFAKARETLMEAFSIINSINEALEEGGPAFAHKRARTSGYVEHALVSLKGMDEYTYDISKQRAIFLMGLRQLVEDELEANLNIQDGKPKLRTEINRLIDRLGILINDNFYLREVQEYHHSNFYYY